MYKRRIQQVYSTIVIKLFLLQLCTPQELDPCIPPPKAPPTSKTNYTVGVLAIRGFEAAFSEFNLTFTDYLTATAGRQFDPPISFQLKPLNFILLFEDVENLDVDFIYVNPSAFSCIESEYGANTLVSQISSRVVGGNEYHLTEFGGVIFTLAHRDDITTVDNLRNQRIAAASISGLGSGQMQFRLMQQAGLSYIQDPAQLVFTSNQGKVVNGVLNGDFDVGFVRTDQIERTKDANGTLVDKSLLKIIEPKANLTIDGEPFPFESSTILYPEWNVAALSHVPNSVALALQTSLLALESHADVGNELITCIEDTNCTSIECEDMCFESIATPNQRCDTTPELALLSWEAKNAGKFTGFRSTLSYMELRNMQEETGFIGFEDGIHRCVRSTELYDAIVCPPGHFRKTRFEVDNGCADAGLECKEEFQCVCSPCVKAFDVDVFEVNPYSADERMEGCSKFQVCGTVMQSNIITFRAIDNKKRADLNMTARFLVGSGAFHVEATPALTDNEEVFAYDFSFDATDSVVVTIIFEVFADGKQIPESPFRLDVVERDCAAENGDSRRVPDSTGNCVCAGGTFEVNNTCVALSVMLSATLIPVALILVISVYVYVERKKKQADSVWAVKMSELHFSDPPEILGRGTFGLVLLAEYRGTQVAVKRVIPPKPNEGNTKPGDWRRRSLESGSSGGLRLRLSQEQPNSSNSSDKMQEKSGDNPDEVHVGDVEQGQSGDFAPSSGITKPTKPLHDQAVTSQLANGLADLEAGRPITAHVPEDLPLDPAPITRKYGSGHVQELGDTKATSDPQKAKRKLSLDKIRPPGRNEEEQTAGEVLRSQNPAKVQQTPRRHSLDMRSAQPFQAEGEGKVQYDRTTFRKAQRKLSLDMTLPSNTALPALIQGQPQEDLHQDRQPFRRAQRKLSLDLSLGAKKHQPEGEVSANYERPTFRRAQRKLSLDMTFNPKPAVTFRPPNSGQPGGGETGQRSNCPKELDRMSSDPNLLKATRKGSMSHMFSGNHASGDTSGFRQAYFDFDHADGGSAKSNMSSYSNAKMTVRGSWEALGEIDENRDTGVKSNALESSGMMSSSTLTDKGKFGEWSTSTTGWGKGKRFFDRKDEYARLKSEFIIEMRHLSKLRHPCITTVMGAVISKGREPMLVMEYMDHGSLYDLLHNETMVVEGELVLPILRDIAQGMRFLHAASPRVIHGDLKAQNVLVDSKFRAKVADFGLSQKKRVGATGTPLWMAPELLRGESENTAMSDVYSFGILLYEVYSRKDPYHGENHLEVLRLVADKKVNKRPPTPKCCPPTAADIMTECLAADPQQRPTMEQLDVRLKHLDVANIEPGAMTFSMQHRKAKQQATRSEQLLFEIFPRHIAEALRDGRKVEPESRDCVTIFFSDIVGYTAISSKLPPKKVSDLLDRLYMKFDELSTKHDVFKIETIGDAYMCVTNLIKDQPDHVKRIAEFSIEACEAASQTMIDKKDPTKGFVKIRVGFHTGPVVANVVGSKSPRYSLIGDTVNTSSRMESNSLPGRIQCSDRAAKLLRQQAPEMKLASRGHIQVKGKGEMETFWVNEESEPKVSSPTNDASPTKDVTTAVLVEMPNTARNKLEAIREFRGSRHGVL